MLFPILLLTVHVAIDTEVTSRAFLGRGARLSTVGTFLGTIMASVLPTSITELEVDPVAIHVWWCRFTTTATVPLFTSLRRTLPEFLLGTFHTGWPVAI